MDKRAIKNFAIWARNELTKKVSQKAAEYGVRNKEIKDINVTSIDGKLLSSNELRQRQILIEKIEKQGFDNVIEEVAYTWFNRFIALRFMEVNGYLPSMIKVFTDENNDFNPEILSQAVYLDFQGLDKEKIFELKENNEDEELFKYLLIAQCNDLNSILPGMFQKISDYTELLFPDNLLRDDSVISRMIIDIPEEDWKDQVQIIGWLYQYYNTEPKDKVINIYKGTVAKDDIPFATQIFTPDWIVRYIVDNSLGRYWIERNPNSKLIEKLEYFVPSKSGEVDYIDEEIKAEELKVYDPSVGSGHFIVYAFDVLMEIYRESGYSDNDAVESILKNNIYALDIDTRAYQLAYFSIMMKARQYSRRIFRKNIEPKVYAFVESDDLDRESVLVNNLNLSEEENKKVISQLNNLLDEFIDAKNLGSILVVSDYDFDLLDKYLKEEIENNENISLFNKNHSINITKLIVKIAKIIKGRYHVVVTNPPYLNKFNPQLKKYVNDNYKDYKSDLFSVFMYMGFENLVDNGYSGYMTPNVWMFIKSYEKLRKFIIEDKNISSLVQLAKGSFYQEATVDVISFVLKNRKYNFGAYIRLEGLINNLQKQVEFFLEIIGQKENIDRIYYINQNMFNKIPGIPIAYWANEAVFRAYKNGELIGDLLDVKQGLATANNDRFLRYWWEVEINKIKFDSKNKADLLESGKKWVPYNKGGKRRQWYGNYDYVVNWENDGYEIKNFKDDKGKLRSRPQNTDYYFREAITWGLITSGGFSIRYRTAGGIHDVSGMSAFSKDRKLLRYVLAILGSKVSDYIFKILNPTINLQVGDFKNFPILLNELVGQRLGELTNENIDVSKKEWDSREESWDFKRHKLIRESNSILESYWDWANTNSEWINCLKENEMEINNLVINLYKLQDVLSSEIDEKDITLEKSDIKNDIKSFISFFIGALFGRYSLDEEGLVFAGGEFDISKYKIYSADKDGIIPMTEIEYFSNDIVSKFVHFIETVYSKETLEENLDFIAEAIGGKGTSRDIIRNYFIKDFYKDHVKTYQKRPIYWMFDSGNKNAFKALIYMHRYEKDTIAKLRTDYIHPTQDLYRSMIEDLEMRKNSASSSEKIKIEKELKDLKDKEAELREYEEKIHHLADQMIEIDLDDGVEHNYDLFKDVLAKRR